MKAKIFCPTHGRLEMDDVMIKSGQPICGKCSAILVFGDVKPRSIAPQEKKKIKKPKKSRKKK